MSDDLESLAGCRVLIVEDEFAVLLLLEDMLAELGCNVVASASNLSDAVNLASITEADIAVLDVNLGRGEKVYPAARVLRDRNIPFVFSTGYGIAGLDAEWAKAPVLQKPYLSRDLAQAIILARSRAK